MRDLKLIPAASDDMKTVSALAKEIWNQYYPAIISKKQIRYMLELMYSKESLDDQLKKKGHQFFLIELKKKRIGFISVNRVKNKDWFINKFYINQDLAAKGIGSKAFAQLLQILQPSTLTLTVNRKNFKSINFYFKMGFKIDANADFDIGKGFEMNDFIMAWRRS